MFRRLSIVAALALLLPALSHAAGLQYHVVPGWPTGGATAPGYGTHAVSAITTDAQGHVYVFQRAEQPLLIFDRDGKYLRSWGAGLFTNPHGCRIDPQGNLWVTDNADHRVMKFTPEGKLLLTLGVRGQAGEDETHFNKPADVAFAPSGDIYVADGYGNSRVVRFSHAGKYLGAWGKKGKGEGEFNLPHSVAVDATGKVYVADRENARIQIFTPEGKFLKQWTETGRPFGLALTREQRLIVSEGRLNYVTLYDLDGKQLTRFGEKGSGPGQFNLPHLLAVDEQGAIYVAEVDGKRVQKFVRD